LPKLSKIAERLITNCGTFKIRLLKSRNLLKLQKVAYCVSVNCITKNSNFSETNDSKIKGVKSLGEETLRCAECNLPG
jgi:hypothetical protein